MVSNEINGLSETDWQLPPCPEEPASRRTLQSPLEAPSCFETASGLLSMRAQGALKGLPKWPLSDPGRFRLAGICLL